MAPGVRTLDLHFQGVPGVIAVFVLKTSDGLALVDVGPASTLPALEAGLADLGHALSEVRHLLITHVHLDHAGAAGEIAARTGARVYVHMRGASHLAQPERLLASAGQIYGEHMDRLWGEMRPVPEAQLTPLEGGETLDLGGLTVQPIYTPGHAIHHLAYRIGEDLFVGDVGGIRLMDGQTPRAPTPPPDIDLEAWCDSVARLRQTGARTLHLAHFGSYPATEDHWEHLLSNLDRDAERVRAGLEAGQDPETLSARFTEALNADLAAEDPKLPARFAFASPAWMSVQGLTRYWSKRVRRGGVIPARLAVFASGRGSNLASLLAAFPIGGEQAVALVVSNREDAPALERAREVGLPAHFVPWPRNGRDAFEAGADELLDAHGVTHLLLAGFMRLLSPAFTARWRGRLLNIHPSLLPDFPGLHAQAQALAAGVLTAGCTVHFVDAGMDTGDTILQKQVPVLPGDTPETLAERLLPAEHEAYPQAARLLLRGLAFPRPTPEEVQAEFGWPVAVSARRLRAARLLRAWNHEEVEPYVLSGQPHPLAALALDTDDLRLAWTRLAPLDLRQAAWAGRGALLERADPIGLAAPVQAALDLTADEWARTTF